MLRRVVALFLLPTVLLTQWVSVRQCHGCSQEVEHELAPHIHLSAWPFAESDSRAHHQCREQRHHRGCPQHGCDSDQESGENRDSLSVRENDESSDHQGEGVVYLPTDFLHGWLTGRTLNGSDVAGNILFLALPDHLALQGKLFRSTHAPLPFLTSPDRPASLRTLPLVI